LNSNGQLVSVDKNNHNSYAVLYPNPTSNTINIKSNINKGKFIIRDNIGRQLLEQPIIGIEEKSIDVSFLPIGFYIISFYEDKELLFSQKWVKINF